MGLFSWDSRGEVKAEDADAGAGLALAASPWFSWAGTGVCLVWWWGVPPGA